MGRYCSYQADWGNYSNAYLQNLAKAAPLCIMSYNRCRFNHFPPIADRSGLGDPSSSSGLLPGLAAVYQLKDLDSFIANTAVPPPPPPQLTPSALNAKTPSEASMGDEHSQV